MTAFFLCAYTSNLARSGVEAANRLVFRPDLALTLTDGLRCTKGLAGAY